MSATQKLIDESNALANRMEKRAKDLSPVEIKWDLARRADNDCWYLHASTRTTCGREYDYRVEISGDLTRNLSQAQLMQDWLPEIEARFRDRADMEGTTLLGPDTPREVRMSEQYNSMRGAANQAMPVMMMSSAGLDAVDMSTGVVTFDNPPAKGDTVRIVNDALTRMGMSGVVNSSDKLTVDKIMKAKDMLDNQDMGTSISELTERIAMNVDNQILQNLLRQQAEVGANVEYGKAVEALLVPKKK
jgi:hypothetical protein